MEKIIEAKNLTKVYGEDGTSVTALNNVNLDFYENKFTAIMGQSGSGKSTLLHCLAGLDKVTSGSIFVKGALDAAIFISKKKSGFYTMNDLLFSK